jgi:hypothetical protein
VEAFDGIIDLLRNDGSIITNKNLAFRIGKDEADIYSELMGKYLYFKHNDELTKDGYFYNTVDNLRLDTTLKAKQQRKAINKLEKIGLIKTDLRGLPPKRHFKPVKDLNILSRLIEEGRIKRKELKEKLAEKGDISKKRYFEGIKSEENAETNEQNMRVNNTKRTILSNNTNNNGHHQSAKVQPIIYAKTIADDECYSAIKYYNHRYYMINDKFLALKVNQWQQVKDKFEKVMDEQGLTVEDMKSVIDRYFCVVDSNDYNILHFISGDIIKNQLASLGLAHYNEVE